jgi:hypothetical protein
MLIDQYADMYRQATSGAGKGAKYADPRLWISMRFLADEGVKPWEPEYQAIETRLQADGEKGMLHALKYMHDFLKAQQEGNRGWLAMHAEEDAGRVLEKLQKM